MTHQRAQVFTGRWLVVAVLLLASAGWVHADIYSTFGDGDSYDHQESWKVEEGFLSGFAFTTGGQSCSLNNISLQMALSLHNENDEESEIPDDEGTEGKLAVSIMTSVEDAPGTVLTTFSFDGITSRDPGILTGVADPLVGEGTLESGKTYWLIAEAITDARIAWYRSNPIIPGQRALSGEDEWSISYPEIMGAFRLTEISPVPVPGAVLLGVLGLGYSGWRLRRRGA